MKLAIQGGNPIRETFLPYGHQWISEEEIHEVIKVLKSNWLTQGNKIKEFEEKVATYCGAKYAVAVSTGTAALHAACFAANIREKMEVITSPISFVASANCVLYQKGIPVFADIQKDTYHIDPKEIKKHITKYTKAIIPVHFTGQPCDIEEIHKIAKRYKLIIIEDAAHALGAKYKGEKIGSLSDMTIFSFHPVKHITTGEGGMILTNKKEFYERLLLFRTHGITKDPNRLNERKTLWYYDMQELGYNYRITDFQCALGIKQLDRLNEFVERRREIAKIYNHAFKDIEEIIIPYEKKEVVSSYHLYVILLRLERLTGNRKEIFEALRAENIGVNVHYIPIYYHSYYQKLGYERGICPNAEEYYERTLTLPLFPKMSDRDVRDVINAVKKVIKYYRK